MIIEMNIFKVFEFENKLGLEGGRCRSRRKHVFGSKTMASPTTITPDTEPLEHVLFQDGDSGKTDSPTILSQNCTLIVRQIPKDAISLQVSDDRDIVSNLWIRPAVKESLFSFVGPLVS